MPDYIKLIGGRIEYNKKPGKPTVIKVVKDNSVPRDDLYKSGTIHTGQGEPPNSRSRPTPKPKQVAGKPITNGKLLRPGGANGGPSKFASRPAAARPIPQSIPQARSQPVGRPIPQQTPQTPLRPQPAASQSQHLPQPTTAQSRPVPQPVAAVNGISHGRNLSSSSNNRAPPPPPPPPTQPSATKNVHRALFDLAGKPNSTELSFTKDDLFEVLQKEDNGITSTYAFSIDLHQSSMLTMCKVGVSPKEYQVQVKRVRLLSKVGPPHHTSRRSITPYMRLLPLFHHQPQTVFVPQSRQKPSQRHLPHQPNALLELVAANQLRRLHPEIAR